MLSVDCPSFLRARSAINAKSQMDLSAPPPHSSILQTIRHFAVALLAGAALGIGPVLPASAQALISPAMPQRLIDLDFFSSGLGGDTKKIRPFIEKLKAAIDSGADIEAADNYGNTPLMNATYWAAWTTSDWGANDVVAFLLTRGANPNKGHTGMGNMTPLDMAAHSLWPNVELVELLCAAGANANDRMVVPEDSFSGADGRPIFVMGFPEIRTAIQTCARKSKARSNERANE